MLSKQLHFRVWLTKTSGRYNTYLLQELHILIQAADASGMDRDIYVTSCMPKPKGVNCDFHCDFNADFN